MKFMHIADVHLGVIPDKGKEWSEIRANEVQESFSRVLKVAKEEKIDLLLIAGDLFHYPPTITMLKELDAKLLELPGVTTIIIAGNHDYMSADSPFDRYEFESDTVVLSSEHPEQVVLDDLKTCVSGISYNRQIITDAMYDSLSPELAWKATEGETVAYPKRVEDYFQILLAHGGDAEHSPMDFKRLQRNGFDYIALGHIHKPEVLSTDRMIYAGSLEPIDITDTGERGYVIGEVKSDGEAVTRWIPFSCRQYIDLVIEVPADWTNYQLQKELQNRIEQQGEEHIYQIILTGVRGEHLQLDLTSILNSYYISRVQDLMCEAIDYEMLEQENRDNILGRFIREMSTDEAPEVETDRVKRLACEYGVKALLANQEG